MNTTINKLTNPNVRHTIKGIYLCEKLNKHLTLKKNTGHNLYLFYFLYLIIKYVCYNRLQQTTSEKTWGRFTAII
jgi:hypothetical protein